MVIAEIIGGLGNQLFEYGAARRVALMFNHELKLDLTFFETYHNPDVFRLDKFNVKYSVAQPGEITKLKRKDAPVLLNRIWKKVFKSPLYFNAKNHFDTPWFRKNDVNQLKNKKSIYLSGYFAKPEFFYEIENILLKEFTLKKELNEINKEMQENIQQVNSVSLHIRRGDYVNNPVFAELPVSYYKKGISIIKDKVKDPVFFIFSDDLNWAKDNLNIDSEVVFVDINDGKTDYMELMIMASCQHNIIANSTFSWWGARLNQNKDKIVLAPKKWFNDQGSQAYYYRSELFQKGWTKI